MFTRQKSQEPETNQIKQISDNLESDQLDEVQEIVDAATSAPAAPSVISSDTIVTGDVLSTGELLIDGKIKGNTRAFQLLVGEHATVEGDLIGDSITVRGMVRGNIRGVEVKLINGCNVFGNILHDQLSMESGSLFEGRIRRAENPLSEEAAKSEQLRTATDRAATTAEKEKPKATNAGSAKQAANAKSDKNPMIVKKGAVIIGN